MQEEGTFQDLKAAAVTPLPAGSPVCACMRACTFCNLTPLSCIAGIREYDSGAAGSRHGGGVRLPAAGAQVHSQQLLWLRHAQRGPLVQHADGWCCHLCRSSDHTGLSFTLTLLHSVVTVQPFYFIFLTRHNCSSPNSLVLLHQYVQHTALRSFAAVDLQ